MNKKLLNSYFAGLIDGEGTVGVYPYKQASKMRPVIKLNMTCQKTVLAIHAHFGGSFMPKKVYNGNLPQWHWIVTFNKAIDVAEAIRPYLITKAAMADKILSCQRKPRGRPRKQQKAAVAGR